MINYFKHELNTEIIDITLPNICSAKTKIQSKDLLNIIRLLNKTGINCMEIDCSVLNKINMLPEDVQFLFRINCINEIDTCIKYNFKRCIIAEEIFQNPKFIHQVYSKVNDIELTLEISPYSICNISKQIKLFEISLIPLLKKIRITGIDNLMDLFWINNILNEIKRQYDLKIEICACNTFYLATSISVECILEGVDYVAASFAGYGGRHGFACLEELLMCQKVLFNSDKLIDLTFLPTLAEYFDRILGKYVDKWKPIIGKDIFKYESGIHVDGIEKNPATYEPFEPYVVGKRRQMYIGKHSGARAIEKKMSEFGIKFTQKDVLIVLNEVRKKSIKLKRSLTDNEIKEVLRWVKILR